MWPRPNPGKDNRSFGVTSNSGCGWQNRAGYLAPGPIPQGIVVYEVCAALSCAVLRSVPCAVHAQHMRMCSLAVLCFPVCKVYISPHETCDTGLPQLPCTALHLSQLGSYHRRMLVSLDMLSPLRMLCPQVIKDPATNKPLYWEPVYSYQASPQPWIAAHARPHMLVNALLTGRPLDASWRVLLVWASLG